MSTSTVRPRVLAGTDTGGRFAAAAHTESPIVLPYPATDKDRVNAAVTKAWHDAVDVYDECPGECLESALGRLRGLAGTRPEDEVRLITAEYISFVLREGEDPAEFAATIEDVAPEMLLGVNIEGHCEWNEPDRPGENGDSGYDWDTIALEVADRWDAKAAGIAANMASSSAVSSAA